MLRGLIKNTFTQAPYTAAFFFQEFAQRRDSYKDKVEEIIPETPEESLSFLKLCI